MAGGFEIPVDLITKMVPNGQSPEKYFEDLAKSGTDAINAVAKAAGQPIKQVVQFEVKDGELQSSIKETSSLP